MGATDGSGDSTQINTKQGTLDEGRKHESKCRRYSDGIYNLTITTYDRDLDILTVGESSLQKSAQTTEAVPFS